MRNKIISAVLAGAMILTAVSACSESHTAISISDTLSVAQRFLSEMKYEQAIIEFDKILEVEPKNVEAYLGKAEAYIALGDTESAIKVLQAGYKQTGDERLKAQIDALIVPAETTIVAETTTEETTAESEIIYDMDADPFEVEDMLLKYIRGEGVLVPELLGNLTELTIYGTDVVMVAVGNKHGTYGYIESYTVSDKSEDRKFKISDINSEFKFGHLSDISFIKDYFPNLNSLEIYFNDVNDISPLKNMKNLTHLKIAVNYGSISDISAVSSLVNLKELALQGSFTDISAVTDLHSLEYLHLSGNIADISSVSGLTNLKTLGLEGNTFSDISAISGLKELTELSLHSLSISENSEPGKNITDITPLNGLTKLERLYIYDSAIPKADGDAFKATHPNCEVWGLD